VPASIPGNILSPTSSSVPSPLVSSSPLLHPICRIILPPPLAYQHSRLHYSISCLRIARVVFPVHLRFAHVYIPMILLIYRCSTSGNPPAALQHGYRCGPAADPIFSSDISSPSEARRYRLSQHRPSSRKGRDTHSRTHFSCSIKENKVVLKASLHNCKLQTSVFFAYTESLRRYNRATV
jgi:hypothetical protein